MTRPMKGFLVLARLWPPFPFRPLSARTFEAARVHSGSTCANGWQRVPPEDHLITMMKSTSDLPTPHALSDRGADVVVFASSSATSLDCSYTAARFN